MVFEIRKVPDGRRRRQYRLAIIPDYEPRTEVGRWTTADDGDWSGDVVAFVCELIKELLSADQQADNDAQKLVVVRGQLEESADGSACEFEP